MSVNPMQRVLDAPRCGAKGKRTGEPCKAPAMPNGRCRLHGGMSPGAPLGDKHWNYKNGRYSKATVERHRETRALIRAIRDLI